MQPARQAPRVHGSCRRLLPSSTPGQGPRASSHLPPRVPAVGWVCPASHTALHAVTKPSWPVPSVTPSCHSPLRGSPLEELPKLVFNSSPRVLSSYTLVLARAQEPGYHEST